MLTVSEDTEEKGSNVAAISAGIGAGVLVTAAAAVIVCAIRR